MLTRFALAGSIVLMCVPGAFAGDLNPPSGAIAPSMKDLDDISPRTAIRNAPGLASPIVIDTPGSYYLAENIQGIGSQHGIEITTSNVTLDLNGFHVIGAEIGSLDGIHINGALTGITILNGTIRGFAEAGIDGINATGLMLRDLRAAGNLGSGFFVGQTSIEGCVANGNISDGISVEAGSSVVGCTAFDNGAHGIRAGQGCAIVDCSSRDNDDDGLIIGAYSSATNCASSQNGIRGFRLISGCTVTGCTAALNGSHGFEVQSFSLSVSIINCTARGNTGAGIYLRDECVATGNGCHANTVDGIFASGVQNRIDSNACAENGDDGIDLDGCSNLVVRNSLSGNGGSAIEGPMCDPSFANRFGTLNTNPATAGPWDNLSHPAAP